MISPYTRSTHVLEVQSMKFMKILFTEIPYLGRATSSVAPDHAPHRRQLFTSSYTRFVGSRSLMNSVEKLPSFQSPHLARRRCHQKEEETVVFLTTRKARPAEKRRPSQGKQLCKRFMAVKELSHFRDFRTLNKRRLRSGTLETQPDARVKGKVVWTQR